MPSKTLTTVTASYLIASNDFTLTNLSTVGGNAVSIGVTVTGTGDTVVNTGTIGGISYGISAANGLTLTNSGTGSVIYSAATGVKANGVYVFSGLGFITNAGNIRGEDGIDLIAGGSVTNLASGTITGAYSAIAENGPFTLTNAGAIIGGFSIGNGVNIGAGGTIFNLAGALISSGYQGIDVYKGSTTIVNAGTVIGGSRLNAVAIGFAEGTNAANNLLVIDPGAVFVGRVDGANTIGSAFVSTLELASGSTAGTLSGLATQFIDFAQINEDTGASWTLTGANTVVAGGTLTVTNATLTATGTLENDGGIVLAAGTLTAASLIGGGLIKIGAGSTLDVQGAIGSGQTIAFYGTSDLLQLGAPGTVAGNVTNFGLGETIDLAGADPASVSFSLGRLNFTVSGTAQSIALAFAPGVSSVQAVTDNAGGADVTALCFCAGSLIATPDGEVPVERLAVGDLVCTLTGETRPIVWIGIGKVLATRGRRSTATPVIVHKGALADNVLHHDLRVTKGHSFLLDGVLIPVEFLVNHRSIEWDDRAQEVSLYHVELDAHDVMIANGAPAESYRDDGNRWLFKNANSGWDFPPQEPCAPLLTGGPVVDAVWRRLLERAGKRPNMPLTDDPDLRLFVDGVELQPDSQARQTYVFKLPTLPAEIRVLSRAAVPSELGLARDARSLGVALQRIVVHNGTRFQAVEAADVRLTDGFHAFEAGDGIRWTDGDAALPTAGFAGFTGPIELVLVLNGATQYALSGDERQRLAS